MKPYSVVLGGGFVDIGSRGASRAERMILAVVSGNCIGIFITLLSIALNLDAANPFMTVFSKAMWHSFIIGMLSAVGAVVMDFKL